MSDDFSYVELWERAQWTNVLYLTDPYDVAPPSLGLVFRNGEAGREIFRTWKAQLGERDAYEKLRLTLLEATALEPGQHYIVALSMDVQQRACTTLAEREQPPMPATAPELVLRLPAASDASERANFKESYAKHGRFYLIPVSVTNGAFCSVQPHFDDGIEKQKLHLR